MVDSETWRTAVRQFESGAWWDCHETLEPAWLEADGTDKRFLAGVILLAAALHKARSMGSRRGGRRNYAKALRHLALVPDRYGGVDVRELEARVHRALRRDAGRPRIPCAPADVDGGRGPAQGQRLLRSRADRRIAGVAGGVAAFIGASPNTVRWVFALSLAPSLGITGIGYLLLWLLLPVERDRPEPT